MLNASIVMVSVMRDRNESLCMERERDRHLSDEKTTEPSQFRHVEGKSWNTRLSSDIRELLHISWVCALESDFLGLSLSTRKMSCRSEVRRRVFFLVLVLGYFFMEIVAMMIDCCVSEIGRVGYIVH